MQKIVNVSVLCLLSLSLLSAQSSETTENELKIEVEEFSFQYEDETLTIKTKADLEGCDSIRVVTLVLYGKADEMVNVHRLLPGEVEEWSFPLTKYQEGVTEKGNRRNYALNQDIKFIFRGAVGDKYIMHEIEKKLW